MPARTAAAPPAIPICHDVHTVTALLFRGRRRVAQAPGNTLPSSYWRALAPTMRAGDILVVRARPRGVILTAKVIQPDSAGTLGTAASTLAEMRRALEAAGLGKRRLLDEGRA